MSNAVIVREIDHNIIEVVTAGPQGLGSAWQQGAGAPSSGLGANGDFYLNTTNGDIYGPKAAGAWGSVVFNITGPTGASGPAGADASYSNATPQALGIAAAGVANSAARSDHVHAMPSASDVGAASIGLAAGLSLALG